MPQAPTVEAPLRLPLVLEPENRDGSTAKDAKLVNGYVEKSKKTGEYWIFKRPGLAQTGATLSGNGYGIYNWQGDIYTVFGPTLYKNGVSIGTVDATGQTVYRFSSSLGATPQLQLSNTIAAYNWNGTTLTTISGVNFPGNSYAAAPVKGWAYLDGTTYVMDVTSYVHGSDVVAGLNAPTLWTQTTNLIGAQIEPDAGVFLAKQLVYVLALKQWSTEVFYDAQNPTACPLGPVQGAKLNYGCASADSVQEIDGTLFWLSTNRGSAVQVIMVDNLKATVVSSKAIDRLLGDADFSTVYSFAFKYEGHKFYGVTMKNSNLTLVYDATEDMWAQWTDTNGNYFPIVGSTYKLVSGAISARVLQHETNGKLYYFDSENTSDDGAMITVDLYTPNWDGGTRRRKQLNLLEFIGDQTVGSHLLVRTNDHDYDRTKWSNFRTVDMSVKKAVLMNNGTFLRRATHIRHACNTRMRLQGIECQVDIGTL